jgi:hypothetical protein
MRQIHAPAQEVQTIPITWLTTVWDLDLLGPFMKVLGGLTDLLVAVDKFTMWIEARPRAKICSKLMSPQIFKSIQLRMLKILRLFELQSQRRKNLLGLICATMKTRYTLCLIFRLDRYL